jgi:hypothetical protein
MAELSCHVTGASHHQELDNLAHEAEPDVTVEGDNNSVGFDGAGLVVWEFSDDDGGGVETVDDQW